MSWVVDEWKEGLPTKTLQKIQELESQLDKLKKERQQKQFQLDSLEAAFQKQKQKVESEKGEVTALKRENQSLIEICDNQEKTRQKMAHDQQVKDQQITLLEGQLSASKKQLEKLEQELKRQKNDLERSQMSFCAMETSLCVTPQKCCTASMTPIKANDSRYEELQEKYSKEVEERKRLETELKILQIKLVNQNSQPASQNAMNHRDIARHQSSSSVFSWQQERTPSRSSSSSSSHDTSLKRSYSSSQCPWEQEETPSKRGLRSDGSNRSFCDSSSSAASETLRSQNQELRSKVTELELRLQVQEKELKTQQNKLQESQAGLEKVQAELQERDRLLGKGRDDLARVTSQYEQAADKCAQAEQKLKKVTEELSCQRQNAESARLTAENKLKEREKENHQELLRQQSSLNNMEQQLNQMKTKLSQEAQQAKNQFNAIQSELDRAVHSKKMLEGEVEELKQKLFKAEQTLQASDNQMSQFRRSLEEAKSQQNAIQSQLDQRSKEALKLEEELNVTNQTLRQKQQLLDQLTNKNNSLEAELKIAMQKVQDLSNLQNLKQSLSNCERERDLAQDLLKKKEREVDESKTKITNMAEECLDLKNRLDCKEKECKDLINTNVYLSQWKAEHESNREKEVMGTRLKELETTIQSNKDQANILENDKKNLQTQIKTLQELVDVKTGDLEAQKVTCLNLQQQLESESQKYQNDTETLVKKIYELEAEIKLQETSDSLNQVTYLEEQLLKERTLTIELQDQYDELLKSKAEMQNEMAQVNEKHEKCVSESQSQIERLQDSLSSKQHHAESVAVSVREKEEQIGALSEKLRLANVDLESSYRHNEELNDKLQKLNLLSESWSAERESLTALINSNQREIEMLTAQIKHATEKIRPKNEKMELLESSATPNSFVNQLKKSIEDSMDTLKPDYDRCKNRVGDPMEDSSFVIDQCETNQMDEMHQSEKDGIMESEHLKTEIREWKEKFAEIERENSRLLRANEELSKLLKNLRSNEFLLRKSAEDLRISLKDRDSSLKKLQNQLKLLKTDYDEKSSTVEEASKSFEKIQNKSSSADESFVEPSLISPSLPKKYQSLVSKENPTYLSGEQSILVDGNDHTLLGDLNETLPSSLGPEHREENQTLLFNLDHLSLSGTEDVTQPLTHLLELSPLQLQPMTPLLSFSSPNLKEDGNRSGVKEGRRSISSELIDLILQQPLEQQQVLFSGLNNEDTGTVNDLMTVYQAELSKLQKQHLAEIAVWQQKLKELQSEMEAKLAEEKVRINQLTQDLEAAKLELQVLDLSARSLLFDNDDITSRFDVANQSLCTVLPIGRLSLDHSHSGKPDSLYPSRGNNSDEGSKETESTETRRSTRIKKKRKTNTAEEISPDPPPKPKESPKENEKLCPKPKESPKENEKLLLLIKEKEHLNKTLTMEIKDLSLQMEIQKTELSNREELSQELEKKSKFLEAERLQLLEKLELLSSEKLQSSNRVVELEKSLNETLTALELLKTQVLELSISRDGFELSNEKWKENCLQAEIELKRTKSEKANIENHALSIEADLNSLQSKCKHLEEESEAHIRSLNNLEENLKAIQGENKQLTQELESLVEEKEELEQMYKSLKERETELESNRENNKELIKMLESDIRGLKEEVLVAKKTTTELAAERDNFAAQQEKDNLHIQEMQTQIQQIQEEKQLILQEQEELKTKLSATNEEKNELSRRLERSQAEKREMSSRLNSAQEEVSLMRTGIEKLKVKIESDERKKQQTMEKLKERERTFDSLNDKIESLERELVMAEENLENAVLQTESAQEEAENLKMQKEALEGELKELRRRLVELEEELQESRLKICEMETSIAALTGTLEARETEHAQMKDQSEKELELLQTQMKDLQEQKVVSEQKAEIIIAEHINAITKLEEEKAKLQQQLEGAQVTSDDLREAAEKLSSEIEECKIQLAEKTQHLMDLESRYREAEELEEKNSAELSRLAMEAENLRNEKNSLLSRVGELETKLLTLSTDNDLLQSMITDLKSTCTDLESQLMSQQVSSNLKLEELQKHLQESEEKVMELESSVRTLKDSLEKTEAEHAQIKDSSERERDQLQTQFNGLQEQKALSDQKFDSTVAEHALAITKLEEEKAQLLQRLEDALVASDDLNLAHLEKELQYSREKIIELEMVVSTLKETLVKTEAEHAQIKDSSEKTVEVLQNQMNDLQEQKALSDHKYESVVAEHALAITKLEEEKAQLLQRLEDALVASGDLNLAHLEKELQYSREKIIELEMAVSTLKETLVKTEAEHAQIKDDSEKALEMLQTQMNDLQEQKDISEQKYDSIVAEHGIAITMLEEEKAQLLQRLEDTLVASGDLKLAHLEKELQSSQEKIVELEMSIATLTERREAEHAQIKDSSDALEVLQNQLNDLQEQKVLSDSVIAEHALAVTKLEEEKAQLLHRLEDALVAGGDLGNLEKELQDSRIKIMELEMSIAALTERREAENALIKDSSEKALEMLQIEINDLRDQKSLSDQKYDLAIAEHAIVVSKLEEERAHLTQQLEEAQEVSSNLKSSVENISSEIEQCKLQLDEKTRHFTALESRSRDAEQLETENSAELSQLAMEAENLRNEKLALVSRMEELETNLLRASSENDSLQGIVTQLKTSCSGFEEELKCVNTERMTLVQKVAELTAEYSSLQSQLQEADLHLRTLQEQSCQDRKLFEEEIQAIRRQLQEKTDNLEQMSKEHATACASVNRWMNSCKQLEEEKEELRKHVLQQEEELKNQKPPSKKKDLNSSDLLSEIEELKQSLEEKTLEADESVEKYCNLMIETHKLEDTNDLLKKQVDFLNSKLQEFEAKKEQNLPSTPSSSDRTAPDADRGGQKTRRSTPDHGKKTNKRQRECDTPGSAPSTPQYVTKRVRKINLTPEDEDCQPEGLPELVRKGFGDIPSGKQSPYVLRRTAVALRKSPRLASQKSSPSPFLTHSEDLENLAELCGPTAGGSKPQPVKTSEALAMAADLGSLDVKSPLSAHNKKQKRRQSEKSSVSKMDVAYVGGGHDDTEEEGNCQVQ